MDVQVGSPVSAQEIQITVCDHVSADTETVRELDSNSNFGELGPNKYLAMPIKEVLEMSDSAHSPMPRDLIQDTESLEFGKDEEEKSRGDRPRVS